MEKHDKPNTDLEEDLNKKLSLKADLPGFIEKFLRIDFKEDRFTMFNSWCQREGVIMPGL
jgi:HSP20 family molecular chaperone IbpA